MTTSVPKLIRTSLHRTIESLGLSRKMEEYTAVDLWQVIVGQRIAKVAIAERIFDGRLYVHVTRSTWRNELVFLKKEIINKINATMGKEIVKDIIFR